MKKEGVLTELILCESHSLNEDPSRPNNIYDALKRKSKEVAEFLIGNIDDGTEPSGLFFACGDIKNMSRQLWDCFNGILQKERGIYD